MLRKILVPLDASENAAIATRIAAEMAAARENHAGLLGLSIVDTDYLPSGRFASLVPREKILAEAERKAEEILENFRAQAKQLDFRPEMVETRSVTGSPFREIIRHSVFCDVIVVGRQCAFPPLEHDYETLAHLYHHASRPVVVTGESHQTVTKVVMAMDGTAPASRMMYAYAHLNPFPAAPVKVIYSAKEKSTHHLEEFFEGVVDFLESYGLKATVEGLDGDLMNHLPAVMKSEQAHLLAMGIPAEHFIDRFRETLRVGGYPIQKLIQETKAALFTVH